MQIKNDGQGRIFSHPLLEKLTRGHAYVPVAMHFTISAVLLIYAFAYHSLNPLMLAAYYLGGLLFWTLFEYLAHRYIFHMDTPTRIREKIQYTFHGIHHEYPRDRERVVMPPVPSFLIGVTIILIFRLIFGTPGFAAVGGFLSGYAFYALIHYSIHTRIPPKNFTGKLWMHHSYHHYRNDKKAYGVSTPLWDYVFGTMPKSYRK